MKLNTSSLRRPSIVTVAMALVMPLLLTTTTGTTVVASAAASETTNSQFQISDIIPKLMDVLAKSYFEAIQSEDGGEEAEDNNTPNLVDLESESGALKAVMTSSNNKASYFQLKMFWRKGYKWKGDWCAECKGSCNTKDKIVVNKCSKDNKFQRWVMINNKLRPFRNQDLCVHTDTTYPMGFKECKSSRDGQQEFDINVIGGKLEFQQLVKNEKYCVSTRRTPYRYKKLRLEKCKWALRDGTSYWLVGDFN